LRSGLNAAEIANVAGTWEAKGSILLMIMSTYGKLPIPNVRSTVAIGGNADMPQTSQKRR